MAYYVRKIARSKWDFNLLESEKQAAYKKVKADAISSCLKTTSNKLSVWKVENKTDSIDDVLPLVLGFNRLDTFDVIYLPEDAIKEKGFQCEHSTEDANVNKESLKELHYNIDVADYEGLGRFVQLVLESAESKDGLKRFNQNTTKTHLQTLLKTQEIVESDLNEELFKKLKKTID